MFIPRLRRIEQAIKEIKEFDKDTELNWRIIQQLLKTGVITSVKIGNAWLINIDELYSLFWNKESKWELQPLEIY